MGYCSGYGTPGGSAGYRGFGFGSGGAGGGRGGGFRHRRFQGHPGRFGGLGVPSAPAFPDPEAERRSFGEVAEALRRRLDDVERRLAAMQAAGRSED
jgi:hypothetical protein